MRNPPEFPSDNPELWRLRAPIVAVELLVAPLETIVISSAAEPEPEPEPASDTDTDTETETGSETETVTESETEIEVHVEVADFDEADFAEVQDGSIPPPPFEPEPECEPAPEPEREPELRAEARPVQPAPDEPPSEARVANENEPFERYVQALVEVGLAAGAPARVMEVLPGMLGAARLNTQGLDGVAIDALVAAGMLVRAESGAVTRADGFVAVAQAWRATMIGEDADFAVCTTTLDEWSAWIIATLAGMPQRQDGLRRELRARGVAAFGMLDAA